MCLKKITSYHPQQYILLEGDFIISIIYFIVGLIAATFGAIAGIGGGVIIKPVLDLLGDYDLPTIGILSAVCVFSMATVSLIRFAKGKVKIDKYISTILAIASIIGGSLGKVFFNNLLTAIGSEQTVAVTQSITLSILMLLIFLYTKNKHMIKTYDMTNATAIFLIGLALGIIAAFLGIGGGPFNVAVLTIGFSMSFKDASINSIFIIFFSQLSALLTTQAATGFGAFDLSMLPYIVTGGIIGGFIGSSLLRRIKSKHVEVIFGIGIMIILAINVFNAVKISFFPF